MKRKLLSLLRRPAVLVLLAVELVMLGNALASALRPAANYTFTADQWESIAQNSTLAYDEEGRIGATEMTEGEDILRTPAMTLPAGHYKVSLDYYYLPSLMEDGMERRSYLYFTSAIRGEVTGEKSCLDVQKQQDTVTLNVRHSSDTVRLVAHNDSGIFTVGTVKIEQDMLYAQAAVLGWLILFVLADGFLLLTVPASPFALADAELCGCLWVLAAVTALTCVPLMTDGGIQGADWVFHLSRIEGIAQGLREGQFPVRVYSMAKNGYGYAPSLFYGELLLYFPAVLRLLGMSVQGAYHAYAAAVQILTAGIAFGSFRQIFKHNKTALLGSVLYMLSSYHIYNIYWRTGVGEFAAQAFLPLIPAALSCLYREAMPRKRDLHIAAVELTVAFSALVQTHVVSLEIAALATAVFCLVNARRTFTKPVLLTWVKAAVLVVLLNLWFLLPFLTVMTSGLYNGMYAHDAATTGMEVQANGLRLSELLTWRDDHNCIGPELLAGTLALLWCWITMRDKEKLPRRERRVGLWAAGLGLLACWMATGTFPWSMVGRLPVVGQFLVAIQFPWRYFSLATLLLVLASISGVSVLRRSGYARHVAVLLLSASLLGLGIFYNNYQPTQDTTYLGDSGQLIYADIKRFNMAWYFDNLYLPDGVSENRNGIEGDENDTTVDVSDITQEGGVTALTCENPSEYVQRAELPLLYYPCYQVVEGPESQLFMTDDGLVGVMIPANYSGTIKVKFQEPKRWLLADAVSLLTVLGLAGYAVYSRKLRKRRSGR